MIRRCKQKDIDLIYEIINDAAWAYKGVIPEDRWKEPYMNKDELKQEIEDGVMFWGYEEGEELIGVMGVQHVKDISLIRHAYVLTAWRNKGIGSQLISFLKTQTGRPLLVGTWQDAAWAIRFYEKHGFKLVSTQEKDRLLNTYWSLHPRHVETSVVLANEKWFVQEELKNISANTLDT